MSDIPLSPMERLLKKAGAARVGEDAKEKMQEALEAYALHIGARAVLFAKHAGRKTVFAPDVLLAIKDSKKQKEF